LENFKQVASRIKARRMKENDKGNINQKDRNRIKHETVEAIMKDLPEDMVVGKAKEGIVIEVPHSHYGAVTIIVNAKVKNMDYDSASAIKEQEERERKAIERIEKHNKDTKGV
jgi:hypothetical protein